MTSVFDHPGVAGGEQRREVALAARGLRFCNLSPGRVVVRRPVHGAEDAQRRDPAVDDHRDARAAVAARLLRSASLAGLAGSPAGIEGAAAGAAADFAVLENYARIPPSLDFASIIERVTPKIA